MKLKIYLFLLCLLTIQASDEDYEEVEDDEEEMAIYRQSCYVYSPYSYYDLSPLERVNSDYGYLAQVINSTDAVLDEWAIYMNLCRPVYEYCDDIRDSWGLTSQLTGDTEEFTCQYRSGSDLMSSVKQSVVQDSETNQRIVQISYTGGDYCSAEDTTYGMDVQIMCNTDEEMTLYDINNDDSCTIVLIFESIYGCPIVEANSLVIFLGINKWIMATVLIILGLFTATHGVELFQKVTLANYFFVSFMIVLYISSNLGYTGYLDPVSSDTISYTLISIVVALVLAFVICLLIKIFGNKTQQILMGILIGFIFGIVLYIMTIYYTYSLVFYYIFPILCLIIGGIFGLYLKHFIMLQGTSFLGSFWFIRGVSIILGFYPSEIMNLLYMRNEVDPSYDTFMYAYYVAIIILFIISLLFQVKKQEKKNMYEGYKKLDI